MAHLREILSEIHEQHGELTAAHVVEAAKPRTHPLHHRFEWDNRIAGPKYREIQAMELIRQVKLVRPSETEPDKNERIRAFVSISDGAEHRVYVPTEMALSNPLQRKMVLRDMERRWRDLQATYGHMVEFAEMIRRWGEEEAV